jgi:hypothetical protein
MNDKEEVEFFRSYFAPVVPIKSRDHHLRGRVDTVRSQVYKTQLSLRSHPGWVRRGRSCQASVRKAWAILWTEDKVGGRRNSAQTCCALRQAWRGDGDAWRVLWSKCKKTRDVQHLTFSTERHNCHRSRGSPVDVGICKNVTMTPLILWSFYERVF